MMDPPGCLVSVRIVAAVGLLIVLLQSSSVRCESDADLIFDDHNAVHHSSESNSINPLSVPDERRQPQKRRASHRDSARFFWDDTDDEGEDGVSPEDRGSGDNDLLTTSGDGTTQPGDRHTTAPPSSPSDPDAKRVYFRVVLTIVGVSYEPRLSNRSSYEFRRHADDIMLNLDPIFNSVRGLQRSTVIDFRPASSPDSTVVRVYIGSMGNNNQQELESVMQRAISDGRIGNIRVKRDNFSFSRSHLSSPPACRDTEFVCDSGHCISQSLMCDRRPDCNDGSDESECFASHAAPSPPPTTRPPTPSHCEFRCRSDECISARQRCDGRRDCQDGSDETHCPRIQQICDSNQFVCDGSRCVDERRRCDGRRDCNDLTDEANCTATPPPSRSCNHLQFQCVDGTCVPRQARCDGRNDCPDKSDERGCPCRSDQFQCDNGFCISLRHKCDGYNNCQDKSDEKNCTILCEDGMFQCLAGGCVPASARCNRTHECKDASDERNCPTVLCRSDQFRCHDGTCLNIGQRCDGVRDCSNGEDEICGYCSPDQFRCQDGKCVPSQYKCNGRFECQDGSDEKNCPGPRPVCKPTDFVCGDGTCVNQTAKCDGRPDCPNHDDELICKECQMETEYACNDGRCLDKRRRCDGRNDCRNAEDEADCPQTALCLPGSVVCRNGTCLPASKRCDGVKDCFYGIDEANCGCRPNEFTCGDQSCIDKRLVCNGYPDCRDGSDEHQDCACRPGDFECGDRSCVPSSKKCDGKPDCRNGQDEVGCGCPSGHFQCDNKQCIPSSDKCNRRYDCTDGSDERDCEHRRCLSSEFQCSDGQCIDAQRKCDRKNDCADGSDEAGCGCHFFEFSCGSGECINSTQKCDGRADCRDRSDETDCRNCLPHQYYCANGQCVERSQRCDGRFDCSDYSDESDCVSREVNLKVYPERQTIRQGREVVFRCRDEGPRRAPVQWTRVDNRPLPVGTRDIRGRLTIPNIQLDQGGAYICTAVGLPAGLAGAQKAAFLVVQPSILFYENFLPQIDPNTYEDVAPTERPTRPPGACARSEATCQNGECITREYVCDGDYDCSDRSDESNCGVQAHCEPSEFQCGNLKCVFKIWRCDGENDCGDNTDEKNCAPISPGSPCRYDEFQCQSGDQCIPKSFQCDGEFDCQDKSDEIGCSAPTITQPPPETLTVAEGETVTITCSAVGNPVPLINWRLNWGHIPPPPRVTFKTEAGHGSVTIQDARTTDGGAWSCEAINSKSSVFATPDCILIVKCKFPDCV